MHASIDNSAKSFNIRKFCKEKTWGIGGGGCSTKKTYKLNSNNSLDYEKGIARRPGTMPVKIRPDIKGHFDDSIAYYRVWNGESLHRREYMVVRKILMASCHPDVVRHTRVDPAARTCLVLS